MPTLLRAFVVALTCLLFGGAGGTEDKPEVTVVASAKGPDADGKQEVTLKLHITKPWYAYANPVGDETLAPNATRVVFAGKGIVGQPVVAYPAGKLKVDGDFKYRIYEDGTEI